MVKIADYCIRKVVQRYYYYSANAMGITAFLLPPAPPDLPTGRASSVKTFAKWSFAEKAPLFRQGLCRMPQMQETESEGEGSVLTHMTKPESRK